MAEATAAPAGTKDRWQVALDKLSEKDRREINSTAKLESLKKLHEAAETQRQACIDNGWVIYKKRDGTKVKVRRILEKIAGAADQIITVGTLGVAFDTSGHAAAPWAVVKVIVSGAASNIKLFAELGEGIETVADTLARFAIVEQLYLGEEADTTQQLDTKITELYVNVLTYLAEAKRYFSASTIGKMGHGIRDALSGRYKEMKDALSETDVDNWVKLADARVREKRDERAVARLDILKQALDNVQQPIMRMAKHLDAVQDDLEKKQRKKVLEWMSTISYINHHELARRNLLQNSGRWLLANDEFVKWKGSPESSILWLTGPAGAGKTSLVSQVVDHLTGGNARQETCPVAYFYCARDTAEPERADASKILSTLLKQLASSSSESEPIRKPVVERYTERAEKLPADGTPLPLSVKESIDLCVRLCRDNPAYIVVDALDECSEDQWCELVEALDRITRKSLEAVKVFLFSRDEVDVKLYIEHSQLLRISMSSETNRDDVQRFIRTEVARLIDKRRLLKRGMTSELRDQTIDALERGADGMFRWVVMSLEYLRPCKLAAEYRDRLGKLPPKLSELYDLLYTDVQSAGKHHLEFVEMVLSLLQVGQGRMSTAVVVAAAFPLDDSPQTHDGADVNTDEDRAQQVVELCHSLVTIDTKESSYRFAHPSVREYIATQRAFQDGRSHARLLRRCLAELMRSCWLRIPYEDYVGISDGLQPPRNTFLGYARRSWTYHCTQVAGTPSEAEEELLVSLNQFLFKGPNTSKASRALQRASRDEPTPVYSQGGRRYEPHRSRPVSLYTDHNGIIRRKRFVYPDTSMEGLHAAAMTNLTIVLDEVIARGYSNIDATRSNGSAALHIAAGLGHHKMVGRLLDLGANPNVRDQSRKTPLHNAIYAGSVGAFNELLSRGDRCDINAHDQYDYTPLMAALEAGQTGLAQRLLSMPGVASSHPALCRLAAKFGTKDILEEILHRTCVGPTVDPGLLVEAIEAGNESTARALLADSRLDVNASAAFIPAVQWRALNILEMLLADPRLDPNICDEDGNTALHWAAMEKDERAAKALLAHPVIKADICNNRGDTPLGLAVDSGAIEVARLIREHGQR